VPARPIELKRRRSSATGGDPGAGQAPVPSGTERNP
jgi:hypothetical protein